MSAIRHARPPQPCPDCGTTIRPSSLARHRLTLTCAVKARTWALAARGFHAYAAYGPPGWWITRIVANTVAPWWPWEDRVFDIARVVRHDYHGSSPQVQWFLRSPVAGVDVTVLLHEIDNVAELEQRQVDGDLVARVLARDPATVSLAHTKRFRSTWPETDPHPEPPPPGAEPTKARILCYDDAVDKVELDVDCDGIRHRFNLCAGGATFPDHPRPANDSACGRLAAGTGLKEFRSMEPLLQARWLELGFAPLDALRWTRLVSSLPTEAALWRDSGLSITQARWFRGSPYEPHEARHILDEALISAIGSFLFWRIGEDERPQV